MTRIGIITIHSVYNYGAMLQAYALSEYLNEKQYNVEIIDYRPYFLCKDYNFFYRDIILRPKAVLGKLKQVIKKGKIFDNFNKFLKEEIRLGKEKYTHISDVDTQYDIILTGSDQIWNPHITGWDEAYLLSLDRSYKCRKMAYSSSFGISEIPPKWESIVQSHLGKFEKIGVREETGRDILKKLLPNKEVNLVLDPVFLLNSEHWKKLSSNKLTPKFKYILVYSLEYNEELINYANVIANELNIKIVTLHPFNNNYSFADLCINTAGPKEFISLIEQAEYVVTNSFHGTVFSIIFEKKLVCLPHSKTGTRISNILNKFDLIQNVSKFSDVNVPIYEMTSNSKKIMNEAISRCYEYLKI